MKLGKQCSSGSYWNSVFYDLNDFSYTDSKVGQLIGHCLRLFILNHKEKKCYWSFTGLILSTVDSSQDWLNGQKKEACVFIQWWNFHKTVKCTNIKCVSKWQARGYFAPEQDWRKHGIYYIQVFFPCLCINLLNADNSALFLYLRSYFWDSLVIWCLRVHIPPLSYWPDFHVFILIAFSAV